MKVTEEEYVYPIEVLQTLEEKKKRISTTNKELHLRISHAT